MELIYIRALDVYPEALIAFLSILLMELAFVCVIKGASRYPVCYASSILPTDGHYLLHGLHANNQHYVKRPRHILSMCLYTILLVFTVLAASIIFLFVKTDILVYYYIYILIAATSVAQFIKAVKCVNKHKQHYEKIRLLDICRVVDDPDSYVLVFIDRNNELYEKITDDPSLWVIGSYYKADCVGNEIIEMDTTQQPKHFFDYQVLRTHTMCTRLCLPIALFVIGVLLLPVNLSTGLIPIAISVAFIPFPRERKLLVIGCKYAVEFKDIKYDCTYVFMLVDKNHNVYYYMTDDDEAVSINKYYLATVSGCSVKTILQQTDNQTPFTYKPKNNTIVFKIIALYAFVSSTAAFLLGYMLTSYVFEVIAIILLMCTIKYDKRGDIC